MFFLQIMVSCSSHTHKFSSWSFDDTTHWQECTECHQKENEVFHTYNKWSIVLEATETKDGLREHVCTVCNYLQQEKIPAISHKHIYGPWQIVKTPDLENSGELVRVCTLNPQHTETSPLPALNPIEYSYTVLKNATCGEAGQEQYVYHKDGQSLSIERAIPKLPHPYTQDWSTDESYHWHKTLCEHTGEKIDFGPHVFINGYCKDCKLKEDEKTHIHQYGEWEIVVVPTALKEGKIQRVCKSNDSHIEELPLPILNDKTYTHTIVEAATCSKEGIEKYIYTLGEQQIVIEQRIPKTEHSYSDSWEYDRTHHWHKALCEHSEEKKDYEQHTFDKGVCILCSYVNVSNGLEYMLNVDGMSYSVVGLGTVRDIEIVIPDQYNGYPVTHIATNAFRNCEFVKSVILLGGIEQIEKFAFSNCPNLVSVELCSSLKWIEESAFSNCLSLEKIHFSEGLEGIRDRAFSDCKNLQKIELPNTLIEFGNYVFSGCSSLEYANYESGLYLGNSSNPYMIYMQTEDTLITEGHIHAQTKFLNNDAFSECKKLTFLVLPEQVLSIGNHCFYYCENLEIIKIGQNVKRIGQSAFSHCESLNQVFYRGTTETWNTIEIKANNDALVGAEIVFNYLEEDNHL